MTLQIKQKEGREFISQRRSGFKGEVVTKPNGNWVIVPRYIELSLTPMEPKDWWLFYMNLANEYCITKILTPIVDSLNIVKSTSTNLQFAQKVNEARKLLRSYPLVTDLRQFDSALVENIFLEMVMDLAHNRNQ
jgi:hypothetical protein